MAILRKHWKKLGVALLFAGSFVLVARLTAPQPRCVLTSRQYFRRVQFSADGKYLLATSLALRSGRSGPGTVHVWKVDSGQEKARLSIESGDVDYPPKLSPDGSLLAVMNGGALRIIDVASAEELAAMPASNEYAFSPDGRTLAYYAGYSSPRELRETPLILWDTQKRRQRAAIDSFWVFAFSPDSRTIATCYYRRRKDTTGIASTITLWDVDSGMKQAEFERPSEYPIEFAFSRDGRRLTWVWASAIAAGDGIKFESMSLDVATGKLRRVGDFVHGSNQSINSGPNRSPRYRTENDGRGLTIWDIHTGQSRRLENVLGRRGLVTLTSPMLSPDGQTLLVADYFDIEESPVWLRLWQFLGVQPPPKRKVYEIQLLDAETGKRRAVLQQAADAQCDNACVSSDGKTLAVWWSDAGQAVYLWDIPPKKPWRRILAWSAGPVAGLLLLVGLFKLWSRRAVTRA